MPDPQLVVNVTDTHLHAMSMGYKLQEIRTASSELEAACNRKIEAADDFGNLVKLVALKAGVEPSVLSTYITAVCNDTLAKKERQAEQLVLLFEEIR